jgi:hypothetical protein
MTLSRRKFIAGSAVAGAGILIGVRFSGSVLAGQESEKAQDFADRS